MDDIPASLRKIFHGKFEEKYKNEWKVYKGTHGKTGEWFFEKERFAKNLRDPQKQLIKDGCIEKWDTTLLTHTLIYSSHFLLLSQIPCGNELKVKKGKGNDKILELSTSSVVDFTQNVKKDDDVLLDFGKCLSGKLQVTDVRQREIVLLVSPSGNLMDAYICSQEWNAVKTLSNLRNTKFAHCPSTSSITKKELDDVVQKIETQYKTLKLPCQSLQDILEGIIITSLY